MKVVFLDVDGVLNTSKTNVLFGPVVCVHKDANERIDPLGVKFFNLLHDAGITIVMSSTWRLGRTIEEMQSKVNIPIRSKTCAWPFKDSIRGDEIKIWLDEHLEVTEYVIVDDDSDMLPEQMPNFVKIDHANGITFENMQAICKILGFDVWELRKMANQKDNDETD